MSEKAQGTQTIPKAFGMVQSSESRQIGTNAKPLSQDEYNVQFEQEATAFEAMREKLLEEYEGKFVAVYRGKIIDFDDDERALFIRVLSKYGVQMPIYFQQVLREGIPIVDIPGIDID
jgi:hypothetical protein